MALDNRFFDQMGLFRLYTLTAVTISNRHGTEQYAWWWEGEREVSPYPIFEQVVTRTFLMWHTHCAVRGE